MTADSEPPPTEVAQPDDDERIEQLMLECLDRIERDGPSALDAFCEQHPQDANTIRRRARLLLDAGVLEATTASEPAAFPERLGEFRLIERLGGGGMGVVYRARQETLGRDVALKIIRPDFLYFENARERFQREMEAVAKLSHPGIVPIYTVGEQDGVPFFAMELVHGCSLHEALQTALLERPTGSLRGADLALAARAASPADATGRTGEDEILFDGTWTEAVTRVGVRVAQALHHVHEQGILHRDVKPSNVMITPGGRVMLLDFGLASPQSAPRLTRSGTALGSIPYMSPEQLAGETTDTRSDVFSLGATLYELLCGELPYPTTATGTGGIAVPEYRPPRRLRDLNPQVSWELETVCLKALDVDPERRYASARDLARDLSHVLEHKPIAARRPGPWLRARRWLQRHPTFTVALSIALLLVSGSALIHAWQQHQARLRVDHQRREAIRAVDQMLTRVARETLVAIPYMEEVRRDLLEDALGFYEGFLRDAGDDAELQVDVARAWQRVGEIRRQMGERDGAEQAFERAHELLEQLPDDVSHDRLMAATLNGYGKLLAGDEPRAADAHGYFSRSVEIRSTLHARSPNDVALQLELANSLSSLGGWLTTHERHDEGLVVCERSVAMLDDLLGDDSDVPDVLEKAGIAHSNLASTLFGLERWDEREAVAARLLELERRLVRARGLPDDRHRLARSLTNEVVVALRRRLHDQARDKNAEARSILAALCSDFPRIVEYRRMLVRCDELQAEIERTSGQIDLAVAAMQTALEGAQDILDAHPDSRVDAQSCAQSGLRLASLLSATRKSDEALEAMDRSIAIHRRLVTREDQQSRDRLALQQALTSRGALHLQSGREEDAATDLREALDLCESLREEDPDDVKILEATALLSHNTAILLQEREPDVALDIARRGLDAAREALANDPENPVVLKRMADLHTTAGGLVGDDLAQAGAHYLEAVELREELHRIQPRHLDHAGDLGGAKANLADVMGRAGDHEEAARLLTEAVGHMRSALQRMPGHPAFGQYLGGMLSMLGHQLVELGRVDEAREIADELASMPGFEEDARALAAAVEADA